MAGPKFSAQEIREYLLGKLGSEERTDEFDRLLVEDEAFFRALEQEEDELIEDYAFGELTAGDATAFEKVFLLSDERRKKVELLAAIRKHISRAGTNEAAPSLPRASFFQTLAAFFRHNGLLAGSVGLLIITVGLLFWFSVGRSGNDDVVLASLNRAFQTERPVEARISGLEYAPKTERRGADPGSIDQNALDLAERTALADFSENESPESIYSLARVLIAKREFQRAAGLLERRLKLTPGDASVLNDLGVAYLGLAESDEAGPKRLEFRANALGKFDAAVKENPGYLPALFNIGIALRGFDLPEREKKAWEDYLERDASSDWADEARERLRHLEQDPVAERSPGELIEDVFEAFERNDPDRAFATVSENREMITGKLIPQQLAFLFADSDPDSAESQRHLAALRFVANAEREATGDPFWGDVAAFYESNGRRVHADLKNAQDAVRAGYERSLMNSYAEGLEHFLTAQRTFVEMGNEPEAALMDYWVGYTRDRIGQFERAEELLVSASEKAERKGYIWLDSHLTAWLTQTAMARDDPAARLRYINKAYELSERAVDPYNSAKITETRIFTYRELGNLTAAMEVMGERIAAGRRGWGSQRQRWRTLDSWSELFASAGFPAAARALHEEALQLTRTRLNEATFEYMSLLRLGQIAARVGDFGSALGHFSESRAVTERFEGMERSRHRAYLDLSEANAMRTNGRCDDARDLFEQAIAFYDAGDYVADRYDAHKGRLICSISSAQPGEIESLTATVFAMLERYRKEIGEEAMRNAFFGREQEIYDALIAYEMRRGDARRALDHAETSRARSLLEQIGQSEVKPMTGAEVIAALPEDVQVIQYAVLDQGLVIWVMRHNELHAEWVGITRGELESAVERYVSLIATPGNGMPEAKDEIGNKLESILIAPIGDRIDIKKPVVIIPDKVLAILPFSALPYGGNGRYLVEALETQYAPSASTFLTATVRAKALSGTREEQLLAVADPAFDRELFRGLSRLAGADREVRQIERNYPKARTLAGKDATVENVLAGISAADVFHFAGHYVHDARSPMDSGMLLAGSEEPLLTNGMIAKRPFSRTRLVVLSACKTGPEQVVPGEGMLGAARTFLAAGIPLVIASQWEVDSDATAELMRDFHKFRRSDGLSTAGAFRRAQLSMLEGPNLRYRTPFYWAPFITYGAMADY